MAKRTQATANSVLALPAELTIYTVGELHPQWLAWFREGSQSAPLDVNAAGVEQVDGAGLQLLLSLVGAASDRGRALRIQDPSEALRQGCLALGLGDWLQTHTTEGVAA